MNNAAGQRSSAMRDLTEPGWRERERIAHEFYQSLPEKGRLGDGAKDAEIAALKEHGPSMVRGTNEDGTPWMGTMREALQDSIQAADAEAKALNEANAEIAALRKDAERYRWISVYFLGADESKDDALVACKTPDEISAVIDAAIAQAAQPTLDAGRFRCEPQPAVNEDGFCEWVCPAPVGYLMQCCDCGLIHEVESRVSKYEPRPSTEFIVVDDPDLQVEWRMKRRDDLAARS